jgi:hypothetical protein
VIAIGVERVGSLLCSEPEPCAASDRFDLRRFSDFRGSSPHLIPNGHPLPIAALRI